MVLLSQVLGSPGGDIGDTVWLPANTAQAWIAAGRAMALEQAVATPETMSAAAPEAAVRRRGRPRKVRG